MQNQVNIQADDMGNVVRLSKNNSDYGFIRLTQDRVIINSNNFVNNKQVSTLIAGKVEDLQALNLKAKSTMPGKIIVKEQLLPFNEVNPDITLKYAGTTGIICCVDGQPIYRKTFFVSDTDAQDILLAHTNGDDIKIANGQFTETKVNKTVQPAEAFGLEKEKTEDIEVVSEEVVEEVVEEAETFEL
jgi:hypothetical protein|tara:strand:- start:1169 stop:1729 length:561 start_codon:yes stop_codon:yes gene_type:complete